MTIWLLCLLAILWGIMIYHHIIYPMIMMRLQHYNNELKTAPLPAFQNRSITILVPAYNEQDVIADKIRNVASLDYPNDKLKLIIACDGCQDNTANIARKAASEWYSKDLCIQIIEFKKNHGKVALLNQLIPDISSDIIALSDASALISMDALKLANKHFEYDEVGVVAATYTLLNPGSEGEKQYWDYQVTIKQGEAAMGSPIGVHGALYFFRQHLFEPMPADTINDDFILPMKIVGRGYQARYDTSLIALELEQASLAMDQKRRIRIAAGNFQQMLRLPELLSPGLGGTALNFLSGKVLRALMPLMILAQLSICAVLAFNSMIFLILAVLQVLGFILARLSLLLPNGELPKHKIFKPIKLAFYLTNGYYSSMIGTFRYLLKLDRGHWQSVSKL